MSASSVLRRGEVSSFVASRVGRSTDPKEVLGLADELKINRAHALGLVVLWEEMVLSVGDALTGKVTGYTAKHVAMHLAWTGPVDKLIAALKTAGVLRTHRGSFIHPWWANTITGRYAVQRAERREDDRERKRRERSGEGVPGTSDGRPHLSAGRPSDTGWNPDSNEVRTSVGQPPQPPANAGGALGEERWKWLLEHHPRPTNPRGCVPYLGRLTDEEWSLLQWVATLPPDGGPYKLSRKKRVLGLDSYQILSRAAYLQLRREWQEKLRAEQLPKHTSLVRLAPPRDEGADRAARLAHATAFVLAALADPTLDEPGRERAKAVFRKVNPDAVPPWEIAPADEPAPEGLPAPETTH